MMAPSPGFARPPEGVRENLGAARRFLMRCCRFVGLLAALPAAAACPLPVPALQAGAVQAAWTVDDGEPIRVGRHVVLALQLCPVDAVLLRVDAVMPEHGHGMNYRPSVTAAPGGRWRAEGLLFHMPGRWDLIFDVRRGNKVQRLSQALQVE